jgi:nitroreductase
MAEQNPGAALAAAARTGGFAPSIHNTQPWHWRVAGSVLELRAVRERQLDITDPLGRMLTVSCGAALHHARVALAAEGWAVQVERYPDRGQPDLLATITLTGRAPVTHEAVRALQTIEIRHTDRRPVAPVPVDPAAIEAIRLAAQGEGARLHPLRPDDVVELASAAARAQRVEELDPDWVEELAYWAGGSNTPSAASPTPAGRGEGLGLTDEVIPARAPQTSVPGRDFGHGGTLPVGEGHDKAAVYAILYSDDDAPLCWLRGGEALSALWLTAIEHDLTVLPLSAAVEVAQTHQVLRHLLAELGEPLLALRIGCPDPDHAGPPRTPRIPTDQLIEIEQ